MIRDILVLALIYGIAFLVLAIPECPTEDSSNCLWIATQHGNGQGATFLDINGTAYYIGKGF